jgi:alpha-tubulin suppressor-like RCC1 family protein
VGATYACARRGNGRVVCWGGNSAYHLGRDDIHSSTVPNEVVLPGEASELLEGKSICAKIGPTDTWCWGGFILLRDSAVLYEEPEHFEFYDGIRDLSGYSQHECAIMVDHTLACRGWNSHGETGNARILTSLEPLPVEGLKTATRVSTGYQTTCALHGKEGRVACFGAGDWGQLGNGEFQSISTVNASPRDVIGLDRVRSIAGGALSRFCALRDDGTVWCWGLPALINEETGQHQPSAVPVPVPGLAGIVDIAVGSNFNCALRDDGVVLCWGENQLRQCGVPNEKSLVFMPTPVEFDPAAWQSDPDVW